MHCNIITMITIFFFKSLYNQGQIQNFWTRVKWVGGVGVGGMIWAIYLISTSIRMKVKYFGLNGGLIYNT